MAESSDWYPQTRPAQRAMYQNVEDKIDNHKTTLELSEAFVARLKLICQLYVLIYDWLISIEATTGQAYSWRDALEKGDESDPVQPVPTFAPLTLPVGAFNGFVPEFRKMIGQIKERDGYTEAIGIDLMVHRVKGAPPNLNEAKPMLGFEEKEPFKVRVTGRMQGFKAINFYFRRRGTSDYFFVTYLTNLPGEITIPAAVPGVPEKGDIKGIFVLDNEEVGQFSDSKELTLR